MKKKIISLLAATAMLTACALPVGATDLGPDTSMNGDTTVTYTVSSTYTVSIPSEVKLSNSDAVTANITLKDGSNIKNDEKVTVKTSGLNSSSEVELVNGTATIKSKVTADGNNITNNTVFAELTNTNKTTTLSFAAVDTDGAVAGEYSKTMTFTVELQ